MGLPKAKALPVQRLSASPLRISQVAGLRLAPCASAAGATYTSTTTQNGTANSNGAVPAINVKLPEPIPGVLPPAQNYNNIVNIGTYKGLLPAGQTFLMGIMAGCYIAFGAFLALSIGGNLPGLTAENPGLAKLVYALVFPVGLTMVTLCGAELYTGNTATVTCALYEKKVTFGQLLKNWFFSYAGNLVGSLLMVCAVGMTGLLTTNPLPVTVAEAKAGLPLVTCIVRAILCNWLVCVAVWQSSAASSLPGKIMGLWAPISAFVAMGLEHSVANMFFIPMGMWLGAKVTFTELFFNNIVPVSVGNTIAGVLCMATMYCSFYGSLGKALFPKEDKPAPLTSL